MFLRNLLKGIVQHLELIIEQGNVSALTHSHSYFYPMILAGMLRYESSAKIFETSEVFLFFTQIFKNQNMIKGSGQKNSNFSTTVDPNMKNSSRTVNVSSKRRAEFLIIKIFLAGLDYSYDCGYESSRSWLELGLHCENSLQLQEYSLNLIFFGLVRVSSHRLLLYTYVD